MPPTPQCSTSENVEIIVGDADATTQKTLNALKRALRTEAGEKFKRGDCPELTVTFFRSVGR